MRILFTVLHDTCVNASNIVDHQCLYEQSTLYNRVNKFSENLILNIPPFARCLLQIPSFDYFLKIRPFGS